MPVDPQIKLLLDFLNDPARPQLSDGTPEEGREMFRRLTVGIRQPDQVVPVSSAEPLELPGPAGPLRARVYRPDATGPVPTVVFFHGGGFVIGDLDTHDNQARAICRDVEAVVLSVDYRLAPEAPWPAAVDDCLAATQWAGEHLDALGGDPARVAVAGDSAGGNLAAVVAQQCRDGHGPALAAQLLIYPAVDFDPDGAYPSRVDNAQGYFLTEDDMRWFEHHYAGTVDDRADARLSPLTGNLAGLPPAVVATAEYDPLRDEGEAYADALEAAGVRVIRRRFDGLIHGFFDLAAVSPGASAAVRECTAALKELLSPPA